MRKAITIVVVLVGFIVLGVFGVLFYAYLNLNSIIADNQGRVLAAVSNALGRDVQAASITASLGWGVSAEISDLKVADDPAISQQPFVEADTVSAKLNLMPLLSKQLDITEVVLEKPIIHIVQTADGKLNVSTIGRKREHREEMVPRREAKGRAGGSPLEEAGAPRKPGALPSLFVKNVTVEDGQLIFDQLANGTKVTVNSIELHVRDFAFDKEFEVDLSLAALGAKQNLDVAAKVGPLLQSGVLDIDAIPLSAKVNAGPFDLDSLKTITMLAKAIPPKLGITQPFSALATADGTVGSVKFIASSDLSANQITFGDSFVKPAGLALKVSAEGARTGAKVEVRLAQVTLGGIEVKVTDIRFGNGATSARVDSNSFDLGPLGQMVPPIARYGVTGKTELHLNVALAGGKPIANGAVVLTGIGLVIPSQKAPPLSGLSGTIKVAGNTADVGPLTFNLGASRATLSSRVESIQPVRLTYQLSADAIRLADLVPSRPPDEQLNQIASSGTVTLGEGGPALNARVTSGSGTVAKVGYQNLALDAAVAGKNARVSSLKLNAFSGALAATADTQLQASAPFNAAISFSNLNVQQALEAQQAKAAGMVRGLLTGNINVSGVSGSFDQMKPTLRGNGRLSLANGKLIGVNVGADALKKVQNLPGIGALISPAIVARHPELFSNPDTDIQSASLTFTLQGPRIISHDIKVQTVDYGMLGDGWFDMDKNIDLAANIILTRAFTQELVSEKQNIVFVTNNNGEVNIPLQIVGQLPKPRVLPDVNQLVQQAGTRAVESQGQKAINKFLGKKGLGGLLGGGGNNNNNGGGNNSQPQNPLDQFKNLF